MHLSVVQTRAFDFATNIHTSIPIPKAAFEEHRADLAAAGTPDCLRDLRYMFTAWEVFCVGDTSEDTWEVLYVDFQGDRDACVVPFATPFYAASAVRKVFAEWKASAPGRDHLELVLEEAWSRFGPGLSISMRG